MVLYIFSLSVKFCNMSFVLLKCTQWKDAKQWFYVFRCRISHNFGFGTLPPIYRPVPCLTSIEQFSFHNIASTLWDTRYDSLFHCPRDSCWLFCGYSVQLKVCNSLTGAAVNIFAALRHVLFWRFKVLSQYLCASFPLESF